MQMLGAFRHKTGQILGGLAVLALCAGAAPGILAASYPSAAPENPGPHLKIHATRYVALAPALVTVYARLSGVGTQDHRFCHPGETWITAPAGAPGYLGTVSRHDPRCVHAAEQAKVSTNFAKDYRFSRPGTYTCRLVLSTNDGRIVQSNQITITVR